MATPQVWQRCSKTEARWPHAGKELHKVGTALGVAFGTAFAFGAAFGGGPTGTSGSGSAAPTGAAAGGGPPAFTGAAPAWNPTPNPAAKPAVASSWRWPAFTSTILAPARGEVHFLLSPRGLSHGAEDIKDASAVEERNAAKRSFSKRTRAGRFCARCRARRPRWPWRLLRARRTRRPPRCASPPCPR